MRVREVLAGQRAMVQRGGHGELLGEEWAGRKRKKRAHPERGNAPP
jgi:hypothetical protein